MIESLIDSPIGRIVITTEGDRLSSLSILPGDFTQPMEAPEPGSVARETARQLTAYFAKRLDDFDLPLEPAASLRGQTLRDAICAIPIGETISYGALARVASSAPRAIGQACARNRLPIVVPCHRVVGSGGAIGHYSAGKGVATKAWLLDHERRGGLL